MATNIRTIGHKHMLVKCVYNSSTYFQIIEPCQIFDSLKPGEQYYTYYNSRRVSCNIITSSNDLDELKDEMSNIRVQNALKTQNPNISVASTSSASASYIQMGLSTKLDENQMFVFGPNGSTISTAKMTRIDWDNYRVAARDLLLAVFSPEVLATHTLLGRNSSRQRLDPIVVEDVIYILCYKCNVSREEVFDTIKRRCFQEYTKNQLQLGRVNDENT